MATVGSCVTVVLVNNEKIYSAQLGDSKVKLFRNLTQKEGEDLNAVKLSRTFNAEKRFEQERLKKEFPDDSDIVVCKRPNNKVCYVKGRLQPTRVIYKKYNILVIR